jgi:hypothetical protein
MPKAIKWRKKAALGNIKAAGEYLTLILSRSEVEVAMRRMQKERESIQNFKAKDILRASNTQLLPETNEDVDAEFRKIQKYELMHPLLLVRKVDKLYIADGFHRLCAAYYLNKNEEIHALLVSLPEMVKKGSS